MTELKRPVNTPASGVPASGIPAGGPGQGPASGYRWPPFEPDNTVSLHHGAGSSRVLSPIAAELRELLHTAAPWTRAAAFALTVEAWAWQEARCSVYRRWFDERGHFDSDGKPLPGLERWDRAETRAQSLRDELGLTPQSLGQLLSRAASVAAAVNDTAALEALRAEGSQILAARAVGELAAGSDLNGARRG